MRDENPIGAALLGWYDRNARVLPWRVGPAEHAAGQRADPYRVWLSEVMLQQTTVAAVRGYFRNFTERWPRVQDLAAAPEAEVMAQWAGLGYYARARNLLKCARTVSTEHDGHFPTTVDALRRLPGIGPYTAAAIAAIAYDAPAVVVDGNVERVVARLFALNDPLPGAKARIAELAGTITVQARPGCHAQAMMDLGATICTPRSPDCAACPLAFACEAKAQGIAAELPRKAPKKAKPTRQGHAYVLIGPAGEVLLERRPGHGLLGGTLGFPGSDWRDTPDPARPKEGGWDSALPGAPSPGPWRQAPLGVRHTFTHFHLELTVHVAQGQVPGMTPRNDFRPAELPTLMRKVWDAAQSALSPHPD